MTQTTYPGTAQQQRALQAVADFYRYDKQILAVSVFGSLGRGNWDEFSDIDLDVVIDDHSQMTAIAEIERLCAALATAGEEAVLIVPSGPDAGDVVFASLLELSIRYHTLATTNWKITDSLVLLCGNLDLATIVAVGQQNRAISGEVASLTELLARYLRYVVGVSVQISRQQLWLAIELLHRMRDLLMQVYAQAHGYQRPVHAFQQQAAPALQMRLAAMLPQYNLQSVCLALYQGLAVVETDLAALSNGRVTASNAHDKVIVAVHRRLQGFHQ